MVEWLEQFYYLLSSDFNLDKSDILDILEMLDILDMCFSTAWRTSLEMKDPACCLLYLFQNSSELMAKS